MDAFDVVFLDSTDLGYVMRFIAFTGQTSSHFRHAVHSLFFKPYKKDRFLGNFLKESLCLSRIQFILYVI